MMSSLFSSLARATGQLGDPAILKVLVKSILATLAIFVLLGVALWWALDAAIETWIVASLPDDYSDTVAGIVTLSVGIFGGWLLFRLVALAVLQFFADDVVLAVEAKHYPEAHVTARALPFRDDLSNSMRGLGRALLANLIALPFALFLLFTGVGTALVFWVVNGWLLGRELQDMVWLRHRTSPDETPPLGAASRFMFGGAIAGMMAVPFLNLLAPVIGAGAATHMVHRRKETST